MISYSAWRLLFFRYLFIAAGIHFTLGFQHNDIFYTPLPLYHTAGGIMSMGQALLFGSTVAIRKKFSASGYFADCVKFDATVGHYVFIEVTINDNNTLYYIDWSVYW